MSAAIACLLSVAASAQQPSGTQPELEPKAIIVTGERIPRSLRETASSVAVISGEEIDGGPAYDRLDQLLAAVPNVQLGSGGEGPTIRGQDTTGAMRDLPAFLGGTRPRTTLVVDGRAVGFSEYVFGVAPLWDVERVEVFRTPQTTTQGRNAVAGAIFVHSRDPAYDWEGRARAVAGDLQTRQLSAAVSGPILDDALAFRLSGDWRKSRPSSRIADNMRGADPNRDEFGLLRFRLLAQPAVIPGARVELTYVHSQSQMPQIEGVRAPFRDRRDPLAGYGIFRAEVDSLTGTLGVDVTPRLKSYTVLSAGKTSARRFAPPGLGEARNRAGDWSAESVVDWTPADAVRLVGGVSYLQASLEQRIDLSQLSGIGTFDDDQRSLGLFGEAIWRLAPRAELTAGLRLQHDRQVRTGALAAASGAIPLDYDRSFTAWLPKVSFAYGVTDALVAGLLVQRAYNPGGATLRFDTGSPDEFAAEFLWNYELFARAALTPGLKARVNLFRAHIRNAQRSQPISIPAPTGSIVTFADLFNLPRARSQGLEAEIDWRVGPSLSAKAGVGLLDTRITQVGEESRSLLGNAFQRSPGLTLAVAADWRPVERVGLTARLRHNSGYYSDDANAPLLRVDGATVIDARASLDVGPTRLFAYARNLLDAFQMTFLYSPVLGTAGDPRELGVGIEAEF